jgi:hypothetical protein
MFILRTAKIMLFKLQPCALGNEVKASLIDVTSGHIEGQRFARVVLKWHH